MVAGPALGADPTAGHPALDFPIVHLNGNHMVDANAHFFQSLRLGQRAGHAVQDEAVLAVGLGHPLGDDAEDQLVGDQEAIVHEFLCFLAQLGTIRHGLAEHIPGRNGGDGELFYKQLRLSPLSGAGSAQ